MYVLCSTRCTMYDVGLLQTTDLLQTVIGLDSCSHVLTLKSSLQKPYNVYLKCSKGLNMTEVTEMARVMQMVN